MNTSTTERHAVHLKLWTGAFAIAALTVEVVPCGTDAWIWNWVRSRPDEMVTSFRNEGLFRLKNKPLISPVSVEKVTGTGACAGTLAAGVFNPTTTGSELPWPGVNP